jgi:YfiH family protein
MNETDSIIPAWPAPRGVRALSTTRRGGVSAAPYDSLNLALHCGDDPVAVRRNRELLAQRLALPGEPMWLTQVHGCRVARAGVAAPLCQADASYTEDAGLICVVLTADCLPLLLCNWAGSRVAAVHAGWRGLAGGVIEAAVASFPDLPGDLLAWMGPAIGPEAFEVGAEVLEAFVEGDPWCEQAFRARGSRWLADIYALARRRLQRLGVGFIGGGDLCTVSAPDRFYSYRRDGTTGRMASLIWID